MQDRRELRAVIDRQFIQLARCLGLGINLRDRCRRRTRTPMAPARPCRSSRNPRSPGRARCASPARGKVAAKRRGDAVAGGFVIHVERIAVERRDLRFARSARGFGLGIDDPLDRASTCLRTPASNVRTLSLMTASSGMTFSFVPACSTPTVTTAASLAATSRDTMVWSRRTTDAAMTTGSMLACGIEPCAPRPNSGFAGCPPRR